jgi:multiple sugar transport system permease protein
MIRRRLAGWMILAAVAALAVLMIIPVLWALGLSLKTNAALMVDTSSVLRAPYTLGNFLDILENSSVFRWVLNSAIVSLGMTIGVLTLSSLAGYGFARLEFPGRKLLFVLVLFGLAIPEQAVILTRHQLFNTLGLHNTYPGLMLPGLAGPFGVFLMTQYFKAIPREIDEAALLDNASRFQVFWRVLLPMTLPAQATLGIFTFLYAWNDYWWPLISGTNERMYTLTVGIASTQVNYAQTAGLGFLTAQAVFASIPILIVYLFFQKYIIRAASGAALT